MAIQLYKAGDSHEVRGIKCEVANFKPAELEARLAEGWAKSPEDIGNGDKQEEIKEAEEELFEEEIDPAEVRERAKVAGIEGWEKKRIKTLINELGE